MGPVWVNGAGHAVARPQVAFVAVRAIYDAVVRIRRAEGVPEIGFGAGVVAGGGNRVMRCVIGIDLPCNVRNGIRGRVCGQRRV